MITTVCLNPSIDRTVWVDRLVPGGTNRVRREARAPGGKGVNTARALAAQGIPACAAVLLGSEDAAGMEAYLFSCGCRMRAVTIEGTMRVNVKVFDESRDEVTEINASGPAISADTIDAATGMIVDCARESEWLVLSGSMPPGCPADYYARLIRKVRAAAPGCRVALDAEGESFRLGVLEGPDFAKPNRHELSLFLGKGAMCEADILEGARALRRAGVGTVIISMGAEGAMLCAQTGCAVAPAVAVPVQTTVGSGDAMLAGYIAAKTAGLGDMDAFRRSITAATANVAGEHGRGDVYLSRVTVREIDALPAG